MKNKIIAKCEELFLELGFKNVTMDDIAYAMGISKKTIYIHFSNKTELIENVVFSVLEFFHKNIEQINKEAVNPIEELYDIKMFVMNYLKNERGSTQFQLKKYYPNIFEQLEVKKFQKMHSSVEKGLKKGIKLNLFRDNIDVGFISRVYFMGMTGIRNTDVFSEEDFSKNYLMESYLEYHLRAIVTAKGLKILNKYIENNKPKDE
tara:strand:+ start:651 stop:1265 length:615 start_codon:yes stop_codon:yes gene_type:complete